MRIDRILKLVRFFDQKQVKRVRKFLKSPYFVQQPALLLLFNFLVSFPAKKRCSVDGPKLCNKLFGTPLTGVAPSGRSQNRKLFNIISDLNLALREYIAVSYLQNDPVRQLFYETAFLADRPNPKFFRGVMTKLETTIKEEYKVGFSHHHYLFLYYKDLSTASAANKITKKKAQLILEPMNKQLELAYLSAKMPLLAAQISNSNIFELQTDQFNWPDTLKMAQKYADEHHPYILLYYQLILLTTSSEENEDLLDRTFSLLVALSSKLEQGAAKEILIALTNYCTIQVKSDKPSYAEKKNRMDIWGINADILVRNHEVLEDSKFLDLAITFMGVKDKLPDCYHFIEKNKNKLPEKTREDAVNLALTYFYYHKENFQLGYEYLEKVKCRKAHFAIRKQSIRVRILYELWQIGNIRLVDISKALRTFQKFFIRNRHGLRETTVHAYLKLEWFVEQFIQYRYLADTQKEGFKQLLAEELNRVSCIAKDWVARKITELN